MNWNLMTYGAQAKNGKLWFSNNKFNGLFCMNLNNMEVRFVSYFPEEKHGRWAMHKKCLVYKDKLIFVPAFGNHIHVYNILNGEISAYQIDEDTSEQSVDRVSDAIISDGYVYLLPMNYNGELKRFNVDTGTLENIPEFMSQVRNVASDEKKYLLARADVDSKGCICFALWDSNILCSYDMSRRKLSTRKCGVDHIFSAHTIDDRSFLLTNSGDSVYEIYSSGSVKIILGSGTTREKDERIYNRVIKFGDEIIVLPAFDDCVYAIKNDRLTEIAKLDLISSESLKVSSFETCVVDNDLWILPFETSSCVVIGQDLSEKLRISFELVDKKARRSILQDIFSESNEAGIVYESKDWGLGDFLSAIAHGDEDS